MYQTRIQDRKKRVAKHRVLEEPDEGQKYGVVQDMLGSGRVKVICEDSHVRMGRIRGSMRKYGNKVIIEKGDIVIVSLRDYEEDKLDIVHKYNYEECSCLSKQGSLPVNIQRAWMTLIDSGASGDNINNQEFIVFDDNVDAI
jgi:translation initiation factor 1A